MRTTVTSSFFTKSLSPDGVGRLNLFKITRGVYTSTKGDERTETGKEKKMLLVAQQVLVITRHSGCFLNSHLEVKRWLIGSEWVTFPAPTVGVQIPSLKIIRRFL